MGGGGDIGMVKKVEKVGVRGYWDGKKCGEVWWGGGGGHNSVIGKERVSFC